jgi:hypothetical protein
MRDTRFRRRRVMGMTRAIDVLLDARALLARPGGWIQGTDEAPREQGGYAYCIQGALASVEGMAFGSSGARRRVEDVLGTQIPAYNDAPTTTQDDVVNVLDRAIEAEWNGDPIAMITFEGPMPPEFVELALRLAEANVIPDLLDESDSSEPFPPAA